MGLYNSIKNFLKGLFASDGTISSKRVVGFGAFLLVAACTIVDLANGKVIDEFIWYGLLALIGACFGLNTFLTSKSMGIKSQVASDIVETQPASDTADDAKEVLSKTIK